MNKVKIYYGSKKWFDKNRPSTYRNLTEVVNELDEQKRKNIMFIANMPKNNESDKMVEDITKKPAADILVADEGEYSGVQEHVIMNFANFLGEIDVNTLILQNPPKQIRNQLEILYPKEKNIIKIEYEKYNHITPGKLKEFNQLYDEHIVGQNVVKKELLPLLYSRTISANRNKPLVLLFCGKPGIGNGASNDLQRATSICRDMVSKYGMSDELGPVVYSDDNNEVFLGKDYGHVNNYSEATSARIDEQIEKMMRKAYSQTESILKTHYDKLELVAETLIKNEKISGDQFTQLMKNGFIADEKVSENEDVQAEDTEIVDVENVNEDDLSSNDMKD